MRPFTTTLCCWLVVSCGGDYDTKQAPIIVEPPATPLVTFAVSDAPSDLVTSVNVTFSSITLKSENDNEDDDSGLNLPILNDAGEPTTMTINLMDYQQGDEKIIIDNVEIAAGAYKNLILNTSGCPQNQNGSTEFCWVVDEQGIKTLKTPSNKLKLGALSVSDEANQSYTIEFNLRSSMTTTAAGASYNLKPHGIRIVDGSDVGSLSGIIDANLLTAGEGCATVYLENSDHGKVVYLYSGNIADDALMGDEFDADVAQNVIPDNLVQPYASDAIDFNTDTATYHYTFAHLPAGDYTVAFSCSAVGDDAEEYDGIMIANPANQRHGVAIEADIESIVNFTENDVQT